MKETTFGFSISTVNENILFFRGINVELYFHYSTPIVIICVYTIFRYTLQVGACIVNKSRKVQVKLKISRTPRSTEQSWTKSGDIYFSRRNEVVTEYLRYKTDFYSSVCERSVSSTLHRKT